MTNQEFLLAVNADEMQAGSRVLHALLLSDHPQVRREVEQALGDLKREQALRCAAHLRGALLAAVTPNEENYK